MRRSSVFKHVADLWSRLPIAARRYILFQALSVPVLFVWILVPYLMLVKGLSVVDAGAILTIASSAAAFLNVVVGKVLDRVEPVLFIAIISFIEGTAYLVYMYGFLADVVMLVAVAAVIERLARGFYPVFAVYEYDVYPDEIRERAFAMHNLIPYLVQLVTYPVIGYVLTVFVRSVEGQVGSLCLFSFASIALGVLALVWLPRTGAKKLEVSQLFPRGMVRGFARMFLAVIFFGMAFELCQPLVVANLFMKISGNPLLGLALYETFAALPVVVISPFVMCIDRKRGATMLALGMGFVALADLMLGLARRTWIALMAAATASAGYAIMDPFFMDTLFSTIPQERRGTLLGSVAASRRLVGIAMPIIAGSLALINAGLPFVVAAAAILVSMGLSMSIAKQRYVYQNLMLDRNRCAR